MDENTRNLTAYEKMVFEKLLSCNFPGRDSLARQLNGMKVSQLDESGCLALEPTVTERAAVKHRIPIEATYPDADGVIVHVDVHVVNGLLFGLEYYREDGGVIVVHPRADELTLFIPTGCGAVGEVAK